LLDKPVQGVVNCLENIYLGFTFSQGLISLQAPLEKNLLFAKNLSWLNF